MNPIEPQEINVINFFNNAKKFFIDVIFISFLISVVFSISYQILVKDYYVSQAVVISSDESDANKGMNVSGLFLPSVSSNSSDAVFIENMVSSVFFEKLFQNEVFKSLFFQEYDLVKTNSSNQTELNTIPENTIAKMHNFYIKKIFRIQNDRSIFRLTVNSSSDLRSNEMMHEIINGFSTYMREKDLEEINKSKNYYTEQLSLNKVPEVSIVLSDLLKSSLQKEVLAYSSKFYNFELIDGPSFPYKSSKTKMLNIFVLTFSSMIFLIYFILFLLFIINYEYSFKGVTRFNDKFLGKF